jgi:dihydrofolate reductase
MEAPQNWHFPYISDDMQEAVNAQIHGSDALLYGRVTYEEFASFWPSQTQNEFGIADKLNNTPKYVVSSTLKTADWNNSTLIKGNVAGEIAKLKQQPGGNIGMTGSATLIQILMQADLIDEYQLFVHPIVVGNGKRLFKDGATNSALKLVGNRTFSGGVILLTYQPDRKS